MKADGARTTSQFVPPEIIAERYHVDREIGRGGMATVYLCTDVQDGSKVALKILRPELGSAVVVERFLREISFASELDHPQIPKVLGSGVIGELPFYVMTYIDGESLRVRLDREKQLPVEEAVRIAEAIVQPTAYAHRMGIIHRDIKPENILLSGDQVYVLDFGVARAILASSGESLTSTGVAIGTPAYMSPEQALADQDLDTRSDIYSVGCVTYEMIAGLPPFVGATPQAVMARRFVAPPPPLSEIRDSVPPPVERAVAKALARAPADRWQRIGQFGDALRATSLSPSLLMAQSAFGTRRRKFVTFASAVVAVIVSMAALGAWSIANRDHLARGRRALERWDVAGAQAEFAEALADHPDDASARLWMGQFLILDRAPLTDWSSLVLKAADSRQSLDSMDVERALALAAYADAGSPTRCDRLRSLSAQRERGHPDDFTPAVTLADCLMSDRAVVADPSSPSGYRFRSSPEEAADLYEGVLQRSENSRAAFKTIVPRLQLVLPTTPTSLRRGVMRGETDQTFIAAPELVADTMRFIPRPLTGSGAPISADPARLSRLIARNLQRLRDVGIAWTQAAPDDPDAQEMLSGILEATAKLDGAGESALSSIHLARAAISGREGDADAHLRKVRLAGSNTRILVKLGRFREARLLADSVLAWKPQAPLSDSLRLQNDALRAGLCGLLGRMQTMIEIEQPYAAEYEIRLASGEQKKLPGVLGSDVLRLRAYTAFGAPREMTMSAYRRVNETLESTVPSRELDDYRQSILRRPMTLAVDVAGTSPLASLGPSSDPFTMAIIALDKRDRRTARVLADSIAALHGSQAPGALTIDVVLQHAWLLAALDDSVGAARVLDRALRGLSSAPAQMLRDATLSAALVRAMMLRAALAGAAHDAAAERQWSGYAQELWHGADPALKSLLMQSSGRQ